MAPLPVFRIYRFFLWAWLLLIATLTYHQFILENISAPNPQDLRGFSQENQVRRGGIYDRNGELIAVTPGLGRERYLVDDSFLFSVGYHLQKVGETGIELNYSPKLSGGNAPGELAEVISAVKQESIRGADVVVTMDRRWQTAACRALGERKGVVIVIDPADGGLLTLVSRPGYSLEKWKKDPSSLLKDDNSPLLNRATCGLYPPGSLFKLIVTAAALRYHQEGRTFVCKGETIIEGRHIRDAGGEIHGRIGLGDALKFSCNSYFLQMGMVLGPARLRAEARRWGLGRLIPLPVPTSSGHIPEGAMSRLAVASMAIGQGELLTTPMQMAHILSAIASGGRLPPIHMVQSIRYPAPGGDWRIFPGLFHRVTSVQSAQKIQEWLSNAVRSGTGHRAYIPGLNVFGKTGTAETGDGPSHAWFLACAEWHGAKRVILVLVEHGGSGGSVAAPIAREILKSAQRGEFW